MFIDFDQIANSARVWVYQADRKLVAEEVMHLKKAAKEFTGQWTAHNNTLASSAEVLQGRFLILAVDENKNKASGCSIDSSVAFVKRMQNDFNINFLDRTQVAFSENGDVFTEPLNDIKEKIAQGKISRDTITFNNLVATKEEMARNWKTKVGDSWLAKYF